MSSFRIERKCDAHCSSGLSGSLNREEPECDAHCSSGMTGLWDSRNRFRLRPPTKSREWIEAGLCRIKAVLGLPVGVTFLHPLPQHVIQQHRPFCRPEIVAG